MAYKKLKLWFDEDLAKLLADKIARIEESFNSEEFIKNVKTRVIDLELKDRIHVISEELYNQLPKNYSKSLSILNQVLGPENDEETGMFKKYYWIMPIAKYVENHGLNDFNISMKFIEEITKRNTGEYTIRPFIEAYPIKTMAIMSEWSTNKNKHIRRLASEGCRPRLPWAKKLNIFIKDPIPIISILNTLKDDKSKYVQKSIANCINDIFKDNKQIAVKIIEDWKQSKPTKECKWIIKHSLRNLLKHNDPWAKEIIKEINSFKV